ncbi:putative Diguanylate cyclase/phosphodiesterase with PAS/PAC sensor(S) [Burkholderiales bacterium]|nr:putative Diguanylate cyclase/phosphodiesterase with PAS/PAC sensor(S) [Burkholderiales bacterium]
MMSKPMSEADAWPAGARAGEASLRALALRSGDWYWETDAVLRLTILHGGPSAAEAAFSQWIGRRDWEIPGELLRPSTWQEHKQRLEARLPFSDLVVRRPLVGEGAAVQQLCGVPIFDPAGQFTGYAGIGRDITEQTRTQDALRDLASIDPLTLLLNRKAFDESAQQVLSDAYARGHQCALLCIGLDRFRVLNSVYGHRVGDRVLAAVAARLREVVRPPNLLGRRGGDEIVALLVDVVNSDLVDAVARDVTEAIARSERLGNIEVSVRASVGVGFFPKDGGDLDALFNAGDAALLRAKEAGGGTQALFTPELARRTELRVLLEQRFRKAYESRDFRLFYQPLVSLPEGRLVGAEALLRWKDAELGDISPGEFIPIAEESGLIEGVGEWVLREACRQRQLWRQIGLDLPPIAINVSGVQMRNPGFVEFVLLTLDEFAVAAEELEIEITETGLIDASAVSQENLRRLRDAGIKAALDDFGVGYSSLAHLRDLPMHRLKIDRSFTIECMQNGRTNSIVQAVIEMAHKLDMTVTAEGVETAKQKDWMHTLGCDSAQGFLFARPMPAEEFLGSFLEDRARQVQRA